ncbi:hypothetical protein P153DRAFT_394599 [Dothidotthia symphoricarpi CBS 119687]|uniref:Uncharacterized protein n=1 Tax=Dothidotthia symphoricarpi CBS 119687 TaxID=1392245 RepID=A0A6A6AKH8_9PLEO|nr:uncharacterized protein P153DRAFT_394599 [Dothidotthia symphoricarpi CBS 119687]KAF2132462.1 hypothetical protein P153DRAFT_394599 [Dothidotthia symphoricarpi CBS 119687]
MKPRKYECCTIALFLVEQNQVYINCLLLLSSSTQHTFALHNTLHNTLSLYTTQVLAIFIMQLTVLLNALLAGLMVSSAAAQVPECVSSNDCCFSTRGACERQSSGWIEQLGACPRVTLCPALGVPLSSCRADCCSLRTKGGRGCPGK